MRLLEDTENWLYEEGEDQNKQVYIDKLAELKVSTAWSAFPRFKQVTDFFVFCVCVCVRERVECVFAG